MQFVDWGKKSIWWEKCEQAIGYIEWITYICYSHIYTQMIRNHHRYERRQCGIQKVKDVMNWLLVECKCTGNKWNFISVVSEMHVFEISIREEFIKYMFNYLMFLSILY